MTKLRIELYGKVMSGYVEPISFSDPISVDSPYFFGLSSFAPYGAQDFTPIVADFRSAFQDEAGDDVYYPHKGNKPKYFLRISPPRSGRRGVKQYISDSIIVPLSVDNTFRFKLAPSSLYHPYGRYIAEFFRRGNQIPVDKQEWLVPAVPKEALLSFRYTSEEDQVLFPLYVWNIRSFSPAANFVSEYNRVTFNTAERPPLNAMLTMKYEPAITLDYLLEYSPANVNSVSRIRR